MQNKDNWPICGQGVMLRIEQICLYFDLFIYFLIYGIGDVSTAG